MSASLKTLALVGMAAMLGGPQTLNRFRSSERNVWKPTFTDEELAEVRALPKKERKKRVAELRAKYSTEEPK